MTKSAFVERLDEVQASLGATLKTLGFSRKGRTFNRSAEEGVVQVINFQSGQFPIGESKPLPPSLAHLQPDLYGKFTVNLGIHIREVWEQGAVRRYPVFIQDSGCQIRTRLGPLRDRKEYWWSLDGSAQSIIADVSKVLLDDGIPFLERFQNRPAILSGWITLNEGPDCLSRRARVDVAIMLAKRGDKIEAARLLREQIDGTHLKGHIEYVSRLARDLGLDDHVADQI